MPTHLCLRLVLVSSFLLVGSQVSAVEIDYEKQIKPLLRERCFACHGSLKQEAGLRVDTGNLLRQGGDSGAAVSLKTPAESLLLERLMSDDDDYRMPPIGKQFSAEEIGLFRDWITSGAVSPKDEAPEADPDEHWAFRAPARPALPQIAEPDWPRSPVDFFLYAQYEANKLQPQADASPAVQLRRLYFDLIGLPPSVEQLEAFLADPSDENYRAEVDRLLASRQYGERWGRHWMDIWRYSDWYGRRQQNDVRNSAPQIWRWRDWIVDSLNDDKGYAQMVQEMIAADEISPTDDTAWPATGYLIRSYYSLNPNEWMRHNVEYSAKAFLGLTFNCAHCHDHKYDPIAHEDYFRLRAFFEPIGIRQDRVAGRADPPPFQQYVYGGSRKVVKEGMVRVYDESPDATTWFYTGGDERNRQKDRGGITPGVPAFLNVPFEEIQPIDLPLTAWYPGARSNIQATVLEACRTELAAAEKSHAEALAKPIDVDPLKKKLAEAKDQFDQAIAAAKQTSVIAGEQSLWMDAIQGRRIIQNTLPGLNSVNSGTTIQFDLKIITDKSFNFQLARDTSKGLTALYLGFVGGKITAYRPGGFQEFLLGEYDHAAGETQFLVKLVLEPEKDVALCTIQKKGADDNFVSAVPIALNGWNPTKNPHQPFTLDCRTGAQVLIDQVSVTAGEQQFLWGFESPKFSAEQDVDGVDGWLVHPASKAPATSLVTMIAGCESARTAHQQWLAAKAELAAATSHIELAQRELAAKRAALESAQATIAADSAKRDGAEDTTIKQLSQAAYAKQLQGDLADGRWRAMQAQAAIDTALALPDSDKDKSKKITAQTAALKTAQSDLKKLIDKQASTPDSTEYRLLSPTTSPQSTGRRAALARWITHPTNPLTPRVAINHIWMRHFGAPLVASVYDFGRNGKAPTHPQLLDWLSVELVENNWSMKHIHRLLLTSRAYRMQSSSGEHAANLANDENNRFLWRMNSRRMEAEVVRDSLLSIAGTLDPTVGGEVLPNTQAATTFRRSLYYEVFPEAGGATALAEPFDPPDPGECFRRTSTVIPQQALAMSNSTLVHRTSLSTAKTIAPADASDDDLMKRAFLTVLSRPAEPREIVAANRFLVRQREITKTEQQVRASLLRVLFNHNDYITIR